MCSIENKPIFSIERIYLKDMSLEHPNSLPIRLEQNMLSAEVEFYVNAEKISESIYEVIISCTLAVKTKNKIVFLIEAKQAGIFKVNYISNDHLDSIVCVMFPKIIFPYLRSNIADAITRADLPPIHLAEINFQALYEEHLANMKQVKVDSKTKKEEQ
ncbi:MAG: protein-export chaperone SecB [Burkholderia sp.]|nr:protein-export chaperone SecB [Burkholderia sp.]